MSKREQADQAGYYEQSVMIILPPSPSIKRLEEICERLGCGERKVLPENRRFYTLSMPGLSPAWAFEPTLSAICQY